MLTRHQITELEGEPGYGVHYTIQIVNKQKNVNDDMAMFAPSLQKGVCEASWFVIGLGNFYFVDSATGAILDGRTTK